VTGWFNTSYFLIPKYEKNLVIFPQKKSCFGQFLTERKLLGNILGIFFTARLVTLDSQAVVTKTEWASQTLLQFNDEIWTRVARWFLFKPKIPIWVNFGGP
jgi:hypothetical protein